MNSSWRISIKCDAKTALLFLATALTNLCHLLYLSLQHSCGRNKRSVLQSPRNTTLQSLTHRRRKKTMLTASQMWQCTLRRSQQKALLTPQSKISCLSSILRHSDWQAVGRVLAHVDTSCHANLFYLQGTAAESKASSEIYKSTQKLFVISFLASLSEAIQHGYSTVAAWRQIFQVRFSLTQHAQPRISQSHIEQHISLCH